MAKKPKTYKELKKVWYQKLAKEGFEDIESDESHLKRWSSDVFNRKVVTEQYGGWQAKAAYYNMAEQLLQEHEFTTEREKTIWEYHTNGISIRDIVEILRKARVKKMSRQAVWLILHRLEDIMKSRYLAGYTSNEQ